MTKSKPLPSLNVLQNVFNYDPDTGILIKKKTGKIQKCPDSKNRYIITHYADQNWQVHRFCFYMGTGINPKDLQVDHIDQDKKNNKLNNLRLLDNSKQQRNIHTRKCNKSGVTGVCLDRKSNRWVAYITVEGKKIKLYYGLSKEQAIKERKIAEKKYYPEIYQ